MRHLKFLWGIPLLVLATVILYASGFQQYHQPFQQVCFRYTGVQPATAISVQTAANWTQTTGIPDCPGPSEVICTICFNTDQYPLDNGKPPFATIHAFRHTVVDHYNTPSDHLQTYNGIFFLFRSL